MRLDEATVFYAFELPSDWPPPIGQVFREHQLENGTFLLLFTPDGRLCLRLYKKSGQAYELLDEYQTPPVVPRSSRTVIFMARWQAGRFTLAAANPIFLKPDQGGEPECLYLDRSQKAGPQIRDYSAENEAARKKRSEKLGTWETKPNRNHGGRNYAFSSLQHEVEQLEDLLALTKRGRQAHVVGLAARLRVLLVGRPLGLLQICGAYLDQQLTIFTSADPDGPTPFPDETAVALNYSVSVDPGDHLNNPIDLDVWLGTRALTVEGRHYTALQVVKEFGDTIGAHRDIDVTEVVSALKRTPGLTNQQYNDIATYVIGLGEVVLSLARRLLALSADPAPRARPGNQMKTESMPIDLREGVSIHLIIEIPEPTHSGKQVIFELGPGQGGPSLRVELSLFDRLQAVFTDRSGREWRTPKFSMRPYFGRLIWLQAELSVGAARGPHVCQAELRLGVNDESRVREFDIRHPSKVDLIFSIGATVDLSHPATFSVAEILHYQKKFLEADRRELKKWIGGRHSIEGLSG